MYKFSLKRLQRLRFAIPHTGFFGLTNDEKFRTVFVRIDKYPHLCRPYPADSNIVSYVYQIFNPRYNTSFPD